ncbi:MAG: hypothetical protein V8T00_09300 [Oscillospiraceae bacterium]
MRVMSVGGGDIVIEGEPADENADVYPEGSFAEITQFCRWRYITLPEYVELNEGPRSGIFSRRSGTPCARKFRTVLQPPAFSPAG